MKRKKKFFLRHIEIPLLRVLRSITTHRVLWGVVFFAVAMLILGVNFASQKLDLRIGQPSPKDFMAPRTIVFESDVLTMKAMQQAEDAIEPSYKVDSGAIQETESSVQNYFERWSNVAASRGNKDDLELALGFVLTPNVARAALDASVEVIAKASEEVLEIVKNVMSTGVQREALDNTRDRLIQELPASKVPVEFYPLVSEMLRHVDIRPNLVFDEVATSQKRELVRNEAKPVQVTIRQGEKILGEGEIISEEQLEALQNLGLLGFQSPLRGLLGLALLLLVVAGIITYYLSQHQREVWNNEQHYVLFWIIFLMTLFVARGVTAINLGGRQEVSVLVGYLVPVAAGSMLTAITFNNSLSVLITVALSLLVGVMTGGQLTFAIVALMSGLTGAYAVSHLNQPTALARASLYIILVNSLTILAMGFMQESNLYTLSLGLLMGVLNGILSTVLTIGILPFLESAFSVTTSVKLLELSNPNQPALRRLLLGAPGTYHHSIMVANLAEAAAEAVGADPLVTRVGSYYHDLGKVKRPYFFIENQVTIENPHDKLAPTLSTLIITSHVKDGLELAKEYRLPRVITDIIAQHHGTGLVTYFYHRALDEGRKGVLESDFRYESPKPQTKEAAIVLLSDSVEAGLRSVQKPTMGRMEGFIRRVIKEKLDDGQLDNCDLTLRQLDAIAQAFVRIMSGAYHSRVEYPETVVKEIEKRRIREGVVHKQSAG